MKETSRSQKVIVIDNYDSFTYNLVQLLGESGAEIDVFRNDCVLVDEIAGLEPDRIIISPGPGYPAQAGISEDLIRHLYKRIPILGVCLGHQCIGEVFGARVGQARRLMHGKVSKIYHQGNDLFAGIENPFIATRYHSLIVEKPLPEILMCTASTDAGEIMALKHGCYPVFGVQFHPESILTASGRRILENFLVA